MRYVTIIALTLLASAASAQQAGWIADAKTGCKVQNPRPAPNESIQWTGSCQSGFAEGRGTLQWFLNGKPTSRTEGEWHAGLLEGRALTVNGDGARYEGEYRGGLYNGRGISTFPNGTRLDGTFRGGKANGRATVSFPDGSKLEADYVDDEAVRGIWTFPNGNRYEGELKNYAKHGKGSWTQTSPAVRYEGEFVENRHEGIGVAILANGDRYDGTWKNNRPNGRGKSYGGGVTNSGVWVDGCLSAANSDNGRWSTFNTTPQTCGFR